MTDIVVTDAFFAKSTYITSMHENGFHIIRRFRNDSVMINPTTEILTGRKGRLKLHDDTIEISGLYTFRCWNTKLLKGSYMY